MTKFRLQKQPCAAFIFALLGIFQVPITVADSIHQPTIAIIIDDMGNQYQNGLDLVRLPYPLTLAFLPGRPHTNKLLTLAKQHQKEIMLHSPMENSLGLKLGLGGLRESMSEQEIKSTLANSFKAIPNMIGINNHMGSKLTTKPIIMKWVMEQVKQHPFYFVDSRTSADSVAAQTAEAFHIPNLSRDIFLDHHQTRKFVQKQFLKLIKIAKEKGSAIAIAHPHKVTVDYLSWALPKLDEKGIRLATVSAIWHIQHPHKIMHQHKQTPQKNWLKTSETVARHHQQKQPPTKTTFIQ